MMERFGREVNKSVLKRERERDIARVYLRAIKRAN